MRTAARICILALCAGAFALGMATGTATVHGAARTGDAPYAVTIKDFMFTPRILTIHAGSKVTWTNKDEEPHKLREVNDVFKSQPLDSDGEFTFEFDTPGTYEYFCVLHPRMTGKIIVEK